MTSLLDAAMGSALEQWTADTTKPVWICRRPDCDGHPHEGADYPHARPQQRPPEGDWLIWLLITGRRWGKTRSAAEWLRDRALSEKGAYAICAPVYSDVRDVCVEGGQREPINRRSGFLSVCEEGEVVAYNRSLGEIRMKNGSRIKMLSADEPDRARGWGFNAAWCDEFSSWRYPATWYETLLPAVTMADTHRFVITSTPKPNELTKALIKRSGEDERVVLVRGRTIDNESNLGRGAVGELRSEMTARQARQELDGELLEDVEGALFSYVQIERARVGFGIMPELDKVLVAVDPSNTANATSDEAGIVVVGRGLDGDAYVLDDLSGIMDPTTWARTAWQAALKWNAEAVVIEEDGGGLNLRSSLLLGWNEVEFQYRRAGRIKPATIAAKTEGRSKRTRAVPVSLLYEQNRVHHVIRNDAMDVLATLEAEMTSWDGTGESPNRLDALTWAIRHLYGIGVKTEKQVQISPRWSQQRRLR